MFLRKAKSNGYEYLMLVESVRENKKVKQRMLYNFGRTDTIKQDAMFHKMVERLNDFLKPDVDKNDNTVGNEPHTRTEGELCHYGYFAYLKLWHSLGIAGCLEALGKRTKAVYSLSDTAFLMAVQHLLEPHSKLGTYIRQQKYLFHDPVELRNLYRCLDQLAANKEFIENRLFDENFTKINQTVDVVFYDVTTFSFESRVKDELRNFGFSKDCRFNEVQVVLGMIIDANGLPIGYELFSGNTFDGKTMTEALKNIRNRFGIHRVIIVADRGLNSKVNLKLIREAGYGYIVAGRIKQMPAAVTALILDDSGYDEMADGVRYRVIEHNNKIKDENGETTVLEENLIITYSKKRADKDRHDRQRLIEKAEKMLEQPSTVKAGTKRGGRKYLKETGDTSYALDQSLIERDSRFDGYYGIQTSEKGMTPPQVSEAYHMLWKIEESFRIMKSTLEVRPVFHSSPTRVKGHFVMCFLAFMMERHMELLLNNCQAENTPDRIRESLNTMQVVKFEEGSSASDNQYLKIKNDRLASKIFDVLEIPIPGVMNTENELRIVFNSIHIREECQLSLF